MTLHDIYPDGVGINPLYPRETDEYLTDLERVTPANTPNELATRVPEATHQMVEQARVAVRDIEVARRKLSYYASVLEVLLQDHPEAVTRLPDDEQALIAELASRLASPESS